VRLRHPRLRRHQHQHRRPLLVLASHRAPQGTFHAADVDPGEPFFPPDGGMTRERDVMSHNMHPGRKSRAGEAKSMPDDQPFCITLLD
jgi:hypothetical protein